MNIENMSDLYVGRLTDESRLNGSCETFSVPASAEELQSIAKAMWLQGIPVTIQGAMTGICGCAVPTGGHVISTEKLNRIVGHRKEGDRYFVTLESGVRLSELLSYCDQNATELSEHTFLPNPSEKSATLGGMFSCNAKGTNSHLHGDTVGAVNKLKLLVPNVMNLEIHRGEYVFDDYGCDVPGLGRLEIENLPKNNYQAKGMMFAHSGCDLIDVIGGSEGMLAVVTELELELKRPAPELWGVMFFFNDKQMPLDFVERAIEHFECGKPDSVKLGTAEYLDEESMELVNTYKKQITLLNSLPDFPDDAIGTIYLELEGASSEDTEAELETLYELFISIGGEEENTWAAEGVEEVEKFRLLRHAVPEAINSEIDRVRLSDSRITKLCTDLEIPSLQISQAERLYSSLLSENGLRGAIFGHAYSKRLHFNIIPRNYTEYVSGRKLIAELLRRFAEIDSCVTWENGIGKTKKDLMLLLTSQRRHTGEAVKKYFDEKSLLNPGNML